MTRQNDRQAKELEVFRARLRETMQRLEDLLIRKREMYGAHNLDLDGSIGIRIRANDKIHRLKRLEEGGPEYEDNRRDTWDDLAGYALLGILYNHDEELENAEDH